MEGRLIGLNLTKRHQADQDVDTIFWRENRPFTQGFMLTINKKEVFFMGNQEVRWGKVLSFAGAFIAFLIGSGFATGQEIMQYFTSYGFQGVLVSITMLILFVYVGGSFITAGYREQFAKGSDIFSYYCGKYIGGFYDIFTILFVFMSYVVMIAGAGATLNEHYGLPVWVGSVLMMVLAGLTVMSGLSKIVDIIGKIGPVIVFISIALGLYSIMNNFDGIAANVALLEAGQIEVMQAGTSWITSASSYVGFCMLWLAAFLAAMGKDARSAKEAFIGSSIGALGFSLACVVVMFGLLAYLPEVAASQIPTLVLAVKVHPAIATVFSIIIFAGIYTTAVPLLWQASARFVKEGTNNFRITTTVLAIIGCFVGIALPFNKLVNMIYVVNGYVGILLVVFIIAKDVRRFMNKKKENTQNTEISSNV